MSTPNSRPQNDSIKDSRNTRAIALDLLTAVIRQAHPLDSALAAHAGMKHLSTQDRGFVRQLVGTCLRHMGEIDAVIAKCVSRPVSPKAQPVPEILRLGAAQLLFLKVPDHAAVDSMVRLTAARKRAGHKGLVNAVLRRIAREGADLLATLDPAQINTPDWLWQSLVSRFGAETAHAIAGSHISPPPLDITVKDPSEINEWAEKLDAEILPTGGLRRAAGGRIEKLPGFDDGAWWVQDAAASLPAQVLLSALTIPVAGARLADLCAAPGGKTAQLAAAGAAVTALDRSAERLSRLRENLGRLKLSADLVEADAAGWAPAAPFDGVLLDAPCSTTGTLRRHPDIAQLKTARDVVSLAAQQKNLLAAAADMVGPKGVLVYAVCSLQAEEGPDQIEAFLAAHPEWARTPIQSDELGGLGDALSGAGDLCTLPCHWPDRGGLDGFFAARLHRR